MKHSKDEIIKAVDRIKLTCSQNCCQYCPLSNEVGKCYLYHTIPLNFDIDEISERIDRLNEKTEN